MINKNTLKVLGAIICFVFFVEVAINVVEKSVHNGFKHDRTPVTRPVQQTPTPTPQAQQSCIFTSDQGHLCGEDAVAWCDLALRYDGQLSYSGADTGTASLEASKACAAVYQQQP